MRFSSHVIFALWATSSPATAFTPLFASRTSGNSRIRTFAEQPFEGQKSAQPNADATSTEVAAAESASVPTAEAAAGAGLGAGELAPFLAPIAALVAGRQALTKRDLIREQVAVTEKDLERIKKDLANTDTIISVRLAEAL